MNKTAQKLFFTLFLSGCANTDMGAVQAPVINALGCSAQLVTAENMLNDVRAIYQISQSEWTDEQRNAIHRFIGAALEYESCMRNNGR